HTRLRTRSSQLRRSRNCCQNDFSRQTSEKTSRKSLSPKSTELTILLRASAAWRFRRRTREVPLTSEIRSQTHSHSYALSWTKLAYQLRVIFRTKSRTLLPTYLKSSSSSSTSFSTLSKQWEGRAN